ELSVRAVEDLHKRAMAERYFSVGPVKDGAARVSGLLPAEHAETIRTVIDAYVNPKAKVRFRDPDAPDPDAPDGDAPDGEALDARTAGQKRADVVRDIFAFAARSADVPDMGGDHPTVWLSTTESELAAGRGLAFFAGASEPAPVAVAGQAACTGGVQQVIFTDDGRLLRLGREKRGFTRRQRRAIALRDGGTCLIPDCTAPAQWCEAHHVTSWREGGPTDVDNGVLVCWYHHHEIDSGPWHVRMTRGKPEVRYTAFGKDTGWTPAGDAWVHAAASARDGTRRHRT
ncbi:HNH endonuclease signature motif containing protein, partial [Gryllotalpicola ginsengisoli]|uniref:HNH endonuclease signature motif containing protein n=1 Tax=Gryllotalpicola ginsengisoli TaxID=444608 RepID=UPI0003B377B3